MKKYTLLGLMSAVLLMQSCGKHVGPVSVVVAGTEKATAHRELGAHVHGSANMLVTLNKSQLEVDFSVPAVSLLGFEHAATEPADKQKLQQALALFKNPAYIAMLGEAANCVLTEGKVETSLLNAVPAGEHATFDAVYKWTCKNPDKLDGLVVPLLSRDVALGEVHLSWAFNDKNGKTNLSPANTVFHL